MSETKFVKTEEEIRNNETYKKVKAICEKHGYNLWCIINEVYDSFSIQRLQVNPVKEYAPDVYYNDKSAFTSNKPNYQFEIQTTAFGALSIKEYPKFMKAVEDAYELVKELSDIPVESWPTIDRKEAA